MMHASRRSTSRLFLDDDLLSSTVTLAEGTAHYLGHVLRLKQGDHLVVFNGRGAERLAVVKSLARKRPELELIESLVPLAEPELELVLVQALVKSDAMDLVVQKATELGVRSIVAVKTDFSVVKLDANRVERRLEHWRRIARSACEQSGRHRPPELAVASSLERCFEMLPDGTRIVFHPDAPRRLGTLDAARQPVTVLIGPEGGFSAADLERIDRAGFVAVDLGPRILRADTAATAACAVVQLVWGCR